MQSKPHDFLQKKKNLTAFYIKYFFSIKHNTKSKNTMPTYRDLSQQRVAVQAFLSALTALTALTPNIKFNFIVKMQRYLNDNGVVDADQRTWNDSVREMTKNEEGKTPDELTAHHDAFILSALIEGNSLAYETMYCYREFYAKDSLPADFFEA